MLVYILLVDGRWALKYVGGIRKLYLFMYCTCVQMLFERSLIPLLGMNSKH